MLFFVDEASNTVRARGLVKVEIMHDVWDPTTSAENQYIDLRD